VAGNATGCARRVPICPDEPLDVSTGKCLLNHGAVGAPGPSRRGWWDARDEQASTGAFWLLLALVERIATWRRTPYDPAPARVRARALGLDDAVPPARPVPGTSR
jgi:hypothetical protein